MRFFRNVFICAMLLVMLTQCGTPVEVHKYIPQNAVWAMSIRPKVLLDHAKNQQTKAFETTQKYFWNTPNATQKQYWQTQILKSGINFAEKAYIFEVIPAEKNEQYLAFTCKLDNESKFDAFMRNVPERDFSILTHAGLHYINFDKKTILAWFNKTILAVRYEKPADDHTIKIRLVKLRDMAKNKSLKNVNPVFKGFSELNTEVNFWAKGEVLSRFVDFKDYIQPFHKDDYLITQMSIDTQKAYLLTTFTRGNKDFKGNDFLGFKRFFPTNFVEKMTEKSVTNKGFSFNVKTQIDTLRNMNFVQFLKENPRYKKDIHVQLPTDYVTMQAQFSPKLTKVSLIFEKKDISDNFFLAWLKVLEGNVN